MNESLTQHVTISRVQIARYASATGDFNPLHFDDEHARRAGLPGVIGHGLLTLGLASRVVTDWCHGEPGRVRSLSMRFRQPVRPGDDLTIEVRPEGRPRDATQILAIMVQCGERTVANGQAMVSLDGSSS